MAGREYHCHSDCHRHAGSNPALTEGVLARPDCLEDQQLFQRVRCFQTFRASSRTFLWWLVLSHIGTDVLDEWVFGFQGASRDLWPSHPPTTTFNVQNGTYFFKKSKTNFSNASLRFLTARSLSWYFSHNPFVQERFEPDKYSSSNSSAQGFHARKACFNSPMRT